MDFVYSKYRYSCDNEKLNELLDVLYYDREECTLPILPAEPRIPSDFLLWGRVAVSAHEDFARVRIEPIMPVIFAHAIMAGIIGFEDLYPEQRVNVDAYLNTYVSPDGFRIQNEETHMVWHPDYAPVTKTLRWVPSAVLDGPEEVIELSFEPFPQDRFFYNDVIQRFEWELPATYKYTISSFSSDGIIRIYGRKGMIFSEEIIFVQLLNRLNECLEWTGHQECFPVPVFSWL